MSIPNLKDEDDEDERFLVTPVQKKVKSLQTRLTEIKEVNESEFNSSVRQSFSNPACRKPANLSQRSGSDLRKTYSHRQNTSPLVEGALAEDTDNLRFPT